MLQEFYKRADKIMRLETAREVVHARRSTLVEVPHEIAPTRKFMSVEKNGDSKKCKGRDHRRSLDAHLKKAKNPGLEGPETSSE